MRVVIFCVIFYIQYFAVVISNLVCGGLSLMGYPLNIIIGNSGDASSKPCYVPNLTLSVRSGPNYGFELSSPETPCSF